MGQIKAESVLAPSNFVLIGDNTDDNIWDGSQ